MSMQIIFLFTSLKQNTGGTLVEMESSGMSAKYVDSKVAHHAPHVLIKL
jgi:hypothetical protein